jgi:DNA-binding GntR family transcriptional regulator
VLASEGLVTLKPRRGCYVTEISERDLDEIFTVMAPRRPVRRRHRPQGQRDRPHPSALIHDLERAAADNDIDGFFEANQAFHQEVQHIADNRWLTQAITDLRKVIKLSRHHSLFSDGRLKQSLAEHRPSSTPSPTATCRQQRQAMRIPRPSGRKAKIAARRDSAA